MLRQDGYIADVFKFAAHSGVLGGEVPVARLERLADMVAADSGMVRWQIVGSLDSEGKPRLTLSVSGRLVLRCQRCLGELGWDLAVGTALWPVHAGQDVVPEDELENDEVDAIEVDGEFDVLSLVEDEIILALPIAPRHADCRVPGAEAADGSERRRSPFAALAVLQGKEIS